MNILDDARSKLLEKLGPLITPQPKLEPYEKYKNINDPIWGTCRFEAYEMSMLDLPIFQRLRGLKQTGLAFLTYPAAEHTRFQHTLGVTTAASRILSSLSQRLHEDAISHRCNSEENRERFAWLKSDFQKCVGMLRIAALIHDLGHSIFSHTSERFFSMISPMPALIKKLTKGESAKPPGAAEVVVYLLVTSEQWLQTMTQISDLYENDGNSFNLSCLDTNDWERIANWILGYEPDPSRTFLAEIISGPLDADKLDYISRDAYFAGLPIGHDFERYISSVCIDYQSNAWRLTMPQRAINALEQLVTARLSLTSYLYHHQKVRAS